MKKTFKIFIFFTLCFLFLGSSNIYSQKIHYDSINKKKYVLIDVRKTYERITSNGYESVEMYEFLGNYYYENRNFFKSKLYFDKLFVKYNLSQISSKSKERYQLIIK